MNELFGQGYKFSDTEPDAVSPDDRDDDEHQLEHTGKDSRQCRALDAHLRERPDTEDQKSVQNNVHNHADRGDDCTEHGLLADLHEAQIRIHKTHQDIADRHHAQIFDTAVDELLITREYTHQDLRADKCRQREKKSDQHGVTHRDTENILEGLRLSFAPVLGAEDHRTGQERIDEKIVYESYLPRQ